MGVYDGPGGCTVSQSDRVLRGSTWKITLVIHRHSIETATGYNINHNYCGFTHRKKPIRHMRNILYRSIDDNDKGKNIIEASVHPQASTKYTMALRTYTTYTHARASASKLVIWIVSNGTLPNSNVVIQGQHFIDYGLMGPVGPYTAHMHSRRQTKSIHVYM